LLKGFSIGAGEVCDGEAGGLAGKADLQNLSANGNFVPKEVIQTNINISFSILPVYQLIRLNKKQGMFQKRGSLVSSLMARTDDKVLGVTMSVSKPGSLLERNGYKAKMGN
jgi:hypothetical protein